MNNFLKWYSVEKDGQPKKGGAYLVRVEFSFPLENIPSQVFMDHYYHYGGGWKKYDCKARHITHYIPLSEIPMPE